MVLQKTCKNIVKFQKYQKVPLRNFQRNGFQKYEKIYKLSADFFKCQ